MLAPQDAAGAMLLRSQSILLRESEPMHLPSAIVRNEKRNGRRHSWRQFGSRPSRAAGGLPSGS